MPQKRITSASRIRRFGKRQKRNQPSGNKRVFVKRASGLHGLSCLPTLDAWPFTPNGKVDLKAIPEADRNAAAEPDYVPPAIELEEKIAAI
ncbi:hypothetical protein ACH95_13275 [Bacillus glycinifermentans]|uniref:Uncharacterized protein n=1 Tax=Bacillus glycinifermentans TaxID=1664069 RepID=A0A0J6EDF9_9BACI|nr:hypothetical protein COP00_06325 [Bacillus glycinifermentans]KMM58591.1 hypothetical protein ACH95_13275 [Bacillus glycinifermentans]KRT95033.1 hypothetical protein AB447_210920 [Bacillus glycinifermentans]